MSWPVLDTSATVGWKVEGNSALDPSALEQGFRCVECQRLAFIHHTSLNLSKWLLNTLHERCITPLYAALVLFITRTCSEDPYISTSNALSQTASVI
jgi:hypothetical protein